MAHSIHQEITFQESADSLYELLLSGQRFGEFTSAPAEIDASEGGGFSCFGGQIIGRNIELVPGERIVQAWRVAAWAEGVFSIVRFRFEQMESAARVTLDHTGFPDEFGEHLESGWPKMYWEPLRAYLAAAE